MNYILYAVPFFFLLIGVELLLEKVRQTHYYRINDAIVSLSAGVLSRMLDIVKAMVPFTIYVVIYENYALLTLPDTFIIWLSVFVLYDFCYYWNHRFGHEISMLWAAHVVHHSSEEYNLTTALRQSSSSFLSWVFYLPLAILGVEPLLLISVGALNLIYQFWVHTRHVPKLGWFELIFVSPSNHRVHHAQNAVYIDKNYGGVFILWDRLFGTFQEELATDPVIFGIRGSLKSWNPLYANVQVYAQLCRDSWHTKKLSDKCRVWFGRTGWRPADVSQAFPIVKTDLKQFQKFDISISLLSKIYCLVQHSLTTCIGLLLLLNINSLATYQQIGIVFWVLFASFSVGMILENRAWAPWLEWLKHLSLLSALFVYVLPFWIMLGLIFSLLTSVIMLAWLQFTYTRTQHVMSTEAQMQ
ncbi:sterol desaturase family protein [Paraglaciecola sp.]|uniref:sterol desaturase family protein n=1 Tax=Paraglaciecola sp. TaxID=1920173 RepID=UPI00273EF7F1|nr:sterol desaturase family protein [Paraglaciecola sp.]MDP5031143.1 sterol desaturase family protein [Paraglaciecola sp.]